MQNIYIFFLPVNRFLRGDVSFVGSNTFMDFLYGFLETLVERYLFISSHLFFISKIGNEFNH